MEKINNIEWDEDKFATLSQLEKDKYLDVILRQNRGKEIYFTNQQLKHRKNKECSLNINHLSNKEIISASKKGLDIQY